MSDELIASLIRSLIWAAVLVILGLTFGPILNHWIRRSLYLQEQEQKIRELRERRLADHGPGRTGARGAEHGVSTREYG